MREIEKKSNKKNRGVTLIVLVVTIMLIVILGGVTVTSSIGAYKQMRFEASKAEIEEMQDKVDEIAKDYETYLMENKNETSKRTYKEYFQDRYNVSFKVLKELKEKSLELEMLIKRYSNLETSENAFYFTTDIINKYFNLKGINDVVVDFNTRVVYSVEGIEDPTTEENYYEESDWREEERKVEYEGKEESSSNRKLNVEKINTYEDNELLVADVELSINKEVKEIEGIYVTKNETKIEEVQGVRVIESQENSTKIIVTVKGEGRYKFKVITLSKEVYESEEIEVKE